jgi:Double zinc ribbon/zinc-ribbon domain
MGDQQPVTNEEDQGMTMTERMDDAGAELYARYDHVNTLRRRLAALPPEDRVAVHQAMIAALDPVLADTDVQRWPVLCFTSYHIRAESNLFLASMSRDPDISRTLIEQVIRDYASARNIWAERGDAFHLCQGSLDTIITLLGSYPAIRKRYRETFDELIGTGLGDAILSYQEAYPLLEEEREHALDLLHLAETMRISVPLMDSPSDKRMVLMRASALSAEASGWFSLTGDGDLSRQAGALNSRLLEELAAVPDRETARAEPEVSPVSSCPSCHAPVGGGARFCGKCGASLVPPPAEPESGPVTVACPKCGKPLTPGIKFCGSCGAAFAFSPDPDQMTHAPGTCPRCGEPMKAGWKFCGKCGTPMK